MAYLIKEKWNDYGYYTLYKMVYCDALQNAIDVGWLKIGEFGMSDGQFSPNLPNEFERLNPEKFFSIGNHNDYYNHIAKISHDKGYEILFSLNDFTVSREVFDKAKKENITRLSLLRDINEKRYNDYINDFYNFLKPPINLTTMRRIYGSTGWDDVDDGLIEMQRLLQNANTHYYYNAIATIGREIIKSIANKIYNDELYRDTSMYPNTPNNDEFKNKLCGFIDYAYADNQISANIKDYIKKTILLVQGLVHKEKAENFECFMCVHAVKKAFQKMPNTIHCCLRSSSRTVSALTLNSNCSSSWYPTANILSIWSPLKRYT